MRCDSCQAVVYRQRLIGGSFKGVDCGCAGRERLRIDGAKNPFGDLQLEHIHDEFGKPVRVTSSRQLAEAEKRYDFCHMARNYNESNMHDPPQQRVMSVTDFYRQKFRG